MLAPLFEQAKCAQKGERVRYMCVCASMAQYSVRICFGKPEADVAGIFGGIG
jgi:hypothetical protein